MYNKRTKGDTAHSQCGTHTSLSDRGPLRIGLVCTLLSSRQLTQTGFNGKLFTSLSSQNKEKAIDNFAFHLERECVYWHCRSGR